ncbi:MAG: hypothetical protein HPY50_17425 [Firmicutes bacterium]|nr:hypothetical protein [Bacillota bacterium]
MERIVQGIIQVIQLAIEDERALKEKYSKLAQDATAPGIKLMFEKFILDQEDHENQLQESLKALRLLYPEVKIPQRAGDAAKKLTSKKFQDFMKTLTETGFMAHVKNNQLAISEEEINSFIKENFKGADRLEDVEITLKQDEIDFALKVSLLKGQSATPVVTSVKLKSFQFDQHDRVFEFELLEPRDVVTNSVVGQVLVGILVLVLQSITNSRIEVGKIVSNLNFLDVISTRIRINLNESFYLGSIFGSRIKNVKVFDFLKIEQVDVFPGELVVHPVLTMLG